MVIYCNCLQRVLSKFCYTNHLKNYNLTFSFHYHYLCEHYLAHLMTNSRNVNWQNKKVRLTRALFKSKIVQRMLLKYISCITDQTRLWLQPRSRNHQQQQHHIIIIISSINVQTASKKVIENLISFYTDDDMLNVCM